MLSEADARAPGGAAACGSSGAPALTCADQPLVNWATLLVVASPFSSAPSNVRSEPRRQHPGERRGTPPQPTSPGDSNIRTQHCS